VKRFIVVKWLLLALAVMLLVASGVWLTGWRPNFDRSIELSDASGKWRMAAPTTGLPWTSLTQRRSCCPHDAVIRRAGEPGKVQFFMKKTLAFGGHPPEANEHS